MVAVVREEALDGVVDRRRVEEVAGRAHLVVVTGAELHDLHRLGADQLLSSGRLRTVSSSRFALSSLSSGSREFSG